jgi:hypothetical protein
MARISALLSSLLALGLAACSHNAEANRAESPGTHTRGTVTEKPSRLGGFAFLIEERPQEPVGAEAGPRTSGDKYHVAVAPETVVQRRTPAGGVRNASLDELAVGMEAEVWFSGPIRESYPMQGTARNVLILDPAP